MLESNFRQPIIAYEPRFDREAYARAEAKDVKRLNAYTKTQLETHLGERLNVVLSTTRYEVRNGQIFGKDTKEPFVDMLIRGRDYRRKNGDPIDFAREDAEVIGFELIVELGREDAEVGKKKVSVSQKGDVDNGSIYDHNFYDIFTLKEDGKGRYIEARRYSSVLTIEEAAKRFKQASLIADDFEITAEHFLANPIDVPSDKFAEADDLHEFLHEEHDYATEEEFDEVKRMTAFLQIACINSLLEKPFDEETQLLSLNAYFNGGDIALSIVRGKNTMQALAFQQSFNTKEKIHALGMQPVRIVATGCGASGGFSVKGISVQIKSPFSVSEFAKKSEDQEWFKCPDCRYQANGPVGNRCPGCGLTKEKYVEKGGEKCD